MLRGLVVQFIPPDVVVVLSGLVLCLTPLQPGSLVTVVFVTVMPAFGAAICLSFFMAIVMMHAMTIAVLVCITVCIVEVIVEVVVMVAALIAHGFFWIQRGPLALWRSAVFPNFIDKEDFGHVVDDEHLSPVRDWFGLSTAEMNVHDEDGERSGGCDHCHGGNVVLP